MTHQNTSESDASETDRPQTAFEQAGEDNPLSLVQEFVLFIRENKKWWLIPILAVLGLVGLLIAFASTGAAPFIYTLF